MFKTWMTCCPSVADFQVRGALIVSAKQKQKIIRVVHKKKQVITQLLTT